MSSFCSVNKRCGKRQRTEEGQYLHGFFGSCNGTTGENEEIAQKFIDGAILDGPFSSL